MTRKPSAGCGSEPEWFKSSYSDSSNGHDCVEVAWFKSSYSDSNEIESCVEVAATPSCATVHVRDSKNLQGPQLGFTSGAWSDFIAYASIN
ncbi:DUF397 domain-containing protein [Streptomyces sp. NPDC001889]